MALTDSLAAHWRLEEASGTRVDVSGNGHDMSAQGTPGNRAGKLSNALDVTATDYCYYADSGNALDCPAGASLTAACWIYLDNLTINGYPLNRWAEDWTLFFTAAGVVSMLARQTGSNATASTPAGTITTGAWYYLVGWFDHTVGANGTVYVQVNNGTVYSTALTSAKTAGSGLFVSLGDLGHTSTAFGGYDGAIDSASIWTRVLTADERTSLYNGGAGLDYPFTVGGKGLPVLQQWHADTFGGGW